MHEQGSVPQSKTRQADGPEVAVAEGAAENAAATQAFEAAGQARWSDVSLAIEKIRWGLKAAMLPIIVGIWAIGLGVALTVGELACFYTLIVSHMSWQGRLEALAAIPLIAVCILLFLRLARFAFKTRHRSGWQKADAIWLLTVGLVAYGGSVPWAIYLVLTKYPELWWLPLVCGPFYCYMALEFVKMFRARMRRIQEAQNSKSPVPTSPTR